MRELVRSRRPGGMSELGEAGELGASCVVGGAAVEIARGRERRRWWLCGARERGARQRLVVING